MWLTFDLHNIQLSRGEICVANLKAPPANGVSLGS